MKTIVSKAVFVFLCVAGAIVQASPLLIFATFSQEAVAQNTPTSEPASKEDVAHLFSTLKLDTMMQLTMKAAADQVKTNLPAILKEQDMELPQEQINSLMDEVYRGYPLREVLDAMVPVYEKHLSKADIHNIEAFYQTPTGQKMLNEMPEMSKDAMQAANPIMKKWMTEVMQRIKTRAEAMAQQRPPQPKPGTSPKPE